jgi:hypothetical protein
MVFLENPWPILSLGITVEVVLVILLIVTRRGVLLGWMLGTATVVGAGVLIEWLVVTDREAIDDALHSCAAAIEANDQAQLLSHVSPSATHLRQEIRGRMDRFEVSMMRISNLEITVNRKADPRVAKAVFTAIGKGRDRKGEYVLGQAYGGKVIVDFSCENGAWRATGYDIQDLKLP